MTVVASGRGLAAALGVSEAAVRKALRRGRIPRQPEGGFDVERCRDAWGRTTDPARTKVREPANPGAHAEVRTEADARDAVALIASVLAAEGANAATIDFNAARTAETILRARERDLSLRLRRGELVEVEEVGREVEREYAVVRNRLLAIPGRLAVKLEGLSVSAIRLALEKELAEALTELHSPAAIGDMAAAATNPTRRASRA